ncbi:unnamed protein product, partial [Mesorhabditis spiculigera]
MRWLVPLQSASHPIVGFVEEVQGQGHINRQDFGPLYDYGFMIMVFKAVFLIILPFTGSRMSEYSNLPSYNEYTDVYAASTAEHCALQRIVGELDEVQQNMDAEHEYYTPKNVFSPEIMMTRSMIQQNIIESCVDESPYFGYKTEADPLYGTIRKEPKNDVNANATIIPPAVPARNRIGAAYPDHSLERILEDLKLPQEHKSKMRERMEAWRDDLQLDSYDAGLTIALIIVIAIGLIGGALFFM